MSSVYFLPPFSNIIIIGITEFQGAWELSRISFGADGMAHILAPKERLYHYKGGVETRHLFLYFLFCFLATYLRSFSPQDGRTEFAYLPGSPLVFVSTFGVILLTRYMNQ